MNGRRFGFWEVSLFVLICEVAMVSGECGLKEHRVELSRTTP